MVDEQKSIFRRGADTGLYFGLYLSVLYMCMTHSVSSPMLNLLALIMMVGVPVIIYKCLRRMYVEEEGESIFSTLWMYGILIFFFGSLISATVLIVYLRWLNPGVIVEQLQTSIEILNTSGLPVGKEIATQLTQMIEQKALPSAVEIGIRTISSSVFTGMLLSMIVAAIVKARRYKK